MEIPPIVEKVTLNKHEAWPEKKRCRRQVAHSSKRGPTAHDKLDPSGSIS